jgi:hypothetical protein
MHLLLKKITVICVMVVLTAHMSGVIPIITVKLFPVGGLFYDKA